MNRVQFRQPAPSGTVFRQGVFDSQIGETIDFVTPTGSIVPVTLLAADVSEDGWYILITVDVPGSLETGDGS